MGDRGNKMNHKDRALLLACSSRRFQRIEDIETYNRESLFPICPVCVKFNRAKITVHVVFMDSLEESKPNTSDVK